MRLAKAVFPTAIIAIVALGVCGATGAMAQTNTALCEVHQDPCEQKNLITEAHYRLPAGKVFTLKGNTMTILCLEMLAKETVGALATAPNPLKITTTKLTFGECGTTAAHNNCTVTAVTLPEDHFLRTALNKASGKSLAGRVLSDCIFAFGEIACAYDETGIELELEYNEEEETEGNIKRVVEEEGELVEGSAPCPETVTLDFEMMSLQPEYIVT